MNLPKPQIDRETSMQLWISERSDYAKEQVVLNNLGIIGFVLKSLKLDIFNEDLQAIGLVGLVKAINGFDAEKGNQFNTYATLVVRNEILMTLRKESIIPVFPLDEPCNLEHGEQISYADMIADSRNFEEEVIANMQLEKMFEFLNEREKRIISLRMGGKTQQEIEKIMGISQSNISKIIKGVCKKWRTENGL